MPARRTASHRLAPVFRANRTGPAPTPAVRPGSRAGKALAPYCPERRVHRDRRRAHRVRRAMGRVCRTRRIGRAPQPGRRSQAARDNPAADCRMSVWPVATSGPRPAHWRLGRDPLDRDPLDRDPLGRGRHDPGLHDPGRHDLGRFGRDRLGPVHQGRDRPGSHMTVGQPARHKYPDPARMVEVRARTHSRRPVRGRWRMAARRPTTIRGRATGPRAVAPAAAVRTAVRRTRRRTLARPGRRRARVARPAPAVRAQRRRRSSAVPCQAVGPGWSDRRPPAARLPGRELRTSSMPPRGARSARWAPVPHRTPSVTSTGDHDRPLFSGSRSRPRRRGREATSAAIHPSIDAGAD